MKKFDVARKIRILHGPYDAAGQAWEIVKAERAAGYYSKLILYQSNKFGYGSDQSLEIEKSISYVRAIKKGLNFIKMLPEYDIFHFYRSRSLLPRHKDLSLIKMFNKKIVMHFFGSEVRRLDIAKKYKFHYASDFGFDPKEEKKKSKTVDFFKKYTNAMIVPDYEVLEYVPGAVIVPLTYNARLISKIKTKFSEGRKIKIIHAPSNRIIKGTDSLLAIIEKLKHDLSGKYQIDFQLVENVNHEKALKAYAKADIVVDQFRLGMYATFSIESMALGKPVLCYIRDDIAKKYPALPILNTNPDNLYKNLRLLIENRELRMRLGKKGIEYTNKVHNPTVVAIKLIKIYESLLRK